MMPGLPLIPEEEGPLEQRKLLRVGSSSSGTSSSQQFDTDPDNNHEISKAQPGCNYFNKLSNKQHKGKDDLLSHPEHGLPEDGTTTTTTTTTSSSSEVDTNDTDKKISEDLSSQHIDNWIQEIERANGVGEIHDEEPSEISHTQTDTRYGENHTSSDSILNQSKPVGGGFTIEHDQHQTRRPHSIEPQTSSVPMSAESKIPSGEQRRQPQPNPGDRSLPQFSRSATVGVMETPQTRSSSRRSTRGFDLVRDGGKDAGGASSALDLIHKYYHSMSEFSSRHAERTENET